ncbi:MAG: hypoxanthine phosphoribosyltransferase [Chloroflexi bacterium]|nr:hypoxanthine phosphoribosyltransferase [Chloroflexota bacterium]
MKPQPTLHLLFRQDEIQAVARRLATEIKADYLDKNPLLIGILKGAFVFMADLMRALNFPLEIDFVKLASYGSGTETCGVIDVLMDVSTPVRSRHVLVVEDIIDTGRTTAYLLDCLRREQPASLRLAVLLDKPSRREVEVEVDYRGFTVPNKFIVGCGLDWDEKYRYLPDIYYVE